DDPEITAFWKQCVETATCDFKNIYEKLSVHFDYYWGESFYKHLLTPLLESLKQKKILTESEGAWIVPLTDEFGKDLTPCILQKKDGATIYATRDVAAAIYRYEKFRFQRMSYIVGADQKLHFQQVFGVLKKIGHTWASNCEHIPFGMYRFKDAKMSTRQGNFVTFEEVLKLTQNKVKELMEQRTLQITFNENEKEEVSEQIALGALVFFDLHADPIKDIDFDLGRVTDFEGETGPYLQYAHTRCHSILRKAKESCELPGKICFDPSLVSLLNQKEEILLVKVLGRFPLHLERALEFSKASQLANYLIDVTKAFGAFYRECHVLGQEPRLTQARLILVEATRRILARGLSLLGIPLPKKM
ncbi:MAG: arginine--tRNA ligase, partial [Bdellovibrio sp.]|nr:arginine--tRNA ligase [Bdellovibrio sp.]